MKTGTERQANLSLAKKIIPPMQYRLTLGLARGEEGEFFMRKIVDAARTAERLYAMHGENLNADGTHPLELHYFDSLSNSDWYVSELGPDGTAFGYAILAGDVEMSEWGYMNINEIFAACPYAELDYHADGLTVERAVGERLAPNTYFSYCAENETD